VTLRAARSNIWPLYLFHLDAVTVNFAVNRYTYCELSSRTDRAYEFSSRDCSAALISMNWTGCSKTHESEAEAGSGNHRDLSRALARAESMAGRLKRIRSPARRHLRSSAC